MICSGLDNVLSRTSSGPLSRRDHTLISIRRPTGFLAAGLAPTRTEGWPSASPGMSTLRQIPMVLWQRGKVPYRRVLYVGKGALSGVTVARSRAGPRHGWKPVRVLAVRPRVSSALQPYLPYPNSCQGTSPHQQGRGTKVSEPYYVGIDVSIDRL